MSLPQLEEHRRIWRAKPALRRVYAIWFDALLAGLPPAAQRVLEVGAGPGCFAEHARAARPRLAWIAADLLPAPWNQLAADAQRLPFKDASLDAIVVLDVLHHLSRPGEFLAEAGRALRPGGRLLAVEPWVTPFSFPIYRYLHQEGCRPRIDPWRPFPADGKDAFQGDNAVAWRLVRAARDADWARFGLAPPSVRPMNAFAYLLSLGFRDASLLPLFAVAPLIALDRLIQPLAGWTGLRALIAWTRPDSAPTP